NSDAVDNEKAALNRLFIALLKARTADEAINFSHEAIEMHGGNGYIEDFVTPRLLRDAQVLTVWEGTANILGLEVLRLIKKYEIHKTFLEKIEMDLNDCEIDEEYLQLIQKRFSKLKEALQYVGEESEEVQTYYAKRIANE